MLRSEGNVERAWRRPVIELVLLSGCGTVSVNYYSPGIFSTKLHSRKYSCSTTITLNVILLFYECYYVDVTLLLNDMVANSHIDRYLIIWTLLVASCHCSITRCKNKRLKSRINLFKQLPPSYFHNAHYPRQVLYSLAKNLKKANWCTRARALSLTKSRKMRHKQPRWIRHDINNWEL